VTLDPVRFARSVWLEATPLPDGRWLVGERIVDPEGEPGQRCTCEDHRYRQAECKHVIRVVRLGALDADTLNVLRGLLPPKAATATRTTTGPTPPHPEPDAR